MARVMFGFAIFVFAALSSAAVPPPHHVQLAAENTSQQPVNFGDLTCMRWTGGSCSVFSCKSDRGPTVCEQGYCMCQSGHCANAEGVCDAYPGEWLGSYALRFVNAYDQQTPYVQATPFAQHTGTGLFDLDYTAAARRHGCTHSLAANADPGKYWKIALTGHGHLRFESNVEPGHVMSIYNNRRRRSQHFLQVQGREVSASRSDADVEDPRQSLAVEARARLAAHSLHASRPIASLVASASGGSANGTKISDDDDLWPVLMPLRFVHPLDATFRLRQTLQDGGGLEIWDPQSMHALSSADRSWMFSDPPARRGVAECEAPGLFFGGDCQGRQLVKIEPPIPQKAVVIGPRDEIFEMGSWGFLEVMLCACCFWVCCCCLCAGGK